MAKLSYSYDEATDMFTIEGMNYSGQFFRDMSAFQTGDKFQVVDRKEWAHGVIIELRRLLTPRALDAAIALKNWLVRLFAPRQ